MSDKPWITRAGDASGDVDPAQHTLGHNDDEARCGYKPFHILHVIYSLESGGAEQQVRLLCRGGRGTFVNSVVCVSASDHVAECLQRDASLVMIARRRQWDPGLWVAIHRAIREIAPDIVHVWLPPVLTVPAMLSARTFGIPVVFSYRTRMMIRGAQSLVEWLTAAVTCTAVVSNNPVSQASWPYRMLYSLKRGATIPNGLEVDTVPKRPANRPADHVVKLLFVGRLVEAKNVLRLLAALALLPHDLQWSLSIYGRGLQEADARATVDKLGCSHKVTFMGYDPDVRQRMHEFDALLMPSLFEGMPNVLIEAFAAELPVVASRIPAIEAVVGHEDVVEYCDPLSVEDIARAVKVVAQRSAQVRERCARAARLAERYDAAKMVQAYSRFYSALLAPVEN
jgi:glycosyltransferase involved in cell wall biosynthesis